MKIALMSDVHDRGDNLLHALMAAKEEGCTRLLFMGDIAELRTLHLLLDEWGQAVDIVFGNNEYDTQAHLKLASQYPEATHHGYEADIEIDQLRIYFTHLPYLAVQKAESALYQAVFYGHTHRAEQHRCATGVVANPGEIGGVRRPPSFAVYDTRTGEIIFRRL